MKKMTCNQLGGACDEVFSANTFEEMGELSRQHAMALVENGDQAHAAAMGKMRDMMKAPGAMEEWFAERKREFENLPES